MATSKTTKKIAPKRTVSAKTTPSAPATKTSSETKTSLMSRINLKNLIIPAVIIVATVNGQPVTRIQLINQLEKKDGKTVLQSIVTEQLILQEAKKRNVSVSEGDVKAEIANIEKSISAQGQNIDTLLAQQGMTRADLNDQVKIQLLLKKMVGSDVKITDKEVDDYIEQNKEAMPAEITPAIRDQVKQQLEQQKLNEKIQAFVANLQSKAKIDYLRKY